MRIADVQARNYDLSVSIFDDLVNKLRKGGAGTSSTEGVDPGVMLRSQLLPCAQAPRAHDLSRA